MCGETVFTSLFDVLVSSSVSRVDLGLLMLDSQRARILTSLLYRPFDNNRRVLFSAIYFSRTRRHPDFVLISSNAQFYPALLEIRTNSGWRLLPYELNCRRYSKIKGYSNLLMSKQPMFDTFVQNPVELYADNSLNIWLTLEGLCILWECIQVCTPQFNSR